MVVPTDALLRFYRHQTRVPRARRDTRTKSDYVRVSALQVERSRAHLLFSRDIRWLSLTYDISIQKVFP